MINIDLKNLNNEYDVGFIGEHNAEKLHIDISSLMSSDISFFVCVFCNGYAETYNSERYYVKDISDNSIDTVLSQSLTKTEKCKMVVGAYGVDNDGKVNLLQKSDIVNLHFLDSIDDTNAMYKPEVEGLYKELVDLENEFNNGLDLLNGELESIATATANANTAATAASAVANDIKQKSENGYFNGAKGDKGDPGTPGKDGAPGKEGYTPIKGVDYFDGAKGEKGDQGEQGVKGDRGEKGEQGEQGLPGTTVYSELSDKPRINNVTLEGDKSLDELGINIPTKTSEVENDSNFVSDSNYNHTDNNFTDEEKAKLENLNNYDDAELKKEIATKQPLLTAGENISISNNVITAACVVKPLQLSENKVTLLTDIVKNNTKGGAYVVTQNGYIQTTGGYKTLIGAGAEFIITLTRKSGVATLIATVQTGSTIVRIDDDMTADDSVRRFVDTSNLISDPAAASLRNTFNASALVGMLDAKQEHGWTYKVEQKLTEAVKAVSLAVNNDITEFIGEFNVPAGTYTANTNFRPYINGKIIGSYAYGGNNMRMFHLHCYITPATPFYAIFSKGIDPGSIAAATGFLDTTTEPITSVGIYYGVEIPAGTKIRILAR